MPQTLVTIGAGGASGGAVILAPSTVDHFPYISGPQSLSRSLALRRQVSALNADLEIIIVGSGTPQVLGGAVLQTAGGFISEGAGSGSFIGGYQAAAAGAGAVAIGRAASAVSANDVAVGREATTDSGGNAVAIGYKAFAYTESTVIGSLTNTTQFNDTFGAAVVIGFAAGATAANQDSGVAVGHEATASTNSVSVGRASTSLADAVGIGLSANAGAGAIAIGSGVVANTGTRPIAIGYNTQVTGSNSIVIGASSTSTTAQTIVIGGGMSGTAANTAYIGTPNTAINTVVFGRGATQASPAAITLAMTDASGANNVAGNTIIRAARSTGNATVANIVLQAGVVGAPGSAIQAATTVGTFGTGGAVLPFALTVSSTINEQTIGEASSFTGTLDLATTASGGFQNGLKLGSYDSVGYIGNALALGGFQAGQWSGVAIYAGGVSVAAFNSGATALTGTLGVSGLTAIGGASNVTPYTALLTVKGSGGTFFVRDTGGEAYFYGAASPYYFGTAYAGSSLVITSGNGQTALVASSAQAIRMPAYGAGAATFDASGNITSVSDERLKVLRGTYRTGLGAIRKLDPIRYKWNQKSGMERKHLYVGFSAQNAQRASRYLVGKHRKTGMLSLQDRAILATLVNAVKELDRKVNRH